MKPVKFKTLTPTAKIPERGSAGAAGYDIYCDQSHTLVAGSRALISTGWAIQIPDGYYAEIRPRSGLAVNHGIDTLAGVIDSDYRGEVKVALINHSSEFGVEIQKGIRVAQLVFKRHETPAIMLVDDLCDSSRGSGGFGSTGVK